MLQIYGYISALLGLAAVYPYIRDILRKTTKPQRTTWFIYATLGSISFFSQLAKGASNSLWLPGMITICTTIIFLLSLKYGVGGFQKKDYIVLFIAVLGLVFWYITKEAAIALYITILIDLSGTWLTVEKAYKHPETETVQLWIFSSLSGLFSLLSVGNLNIVLISYPAYILIADAAVAGTILMSKHLKN